MTHLAAQTSPQTSPYTEALAGARDTVPLIVGAVPFGLIFGALALASGLSLAGTMAMSAFVFAGSAQFIAVGLIAAGTGWPLIVLTTFVVNLRHALYSATLAPYASKLPQRWQIAMAFWLTDETFAVVAQRFQTATPLPGTRWYYLGSALAMYLNWQFCTFLGATIGQMLPNAAAWGLDFAMPVTFIGMTIPYLKTRPMIATALTAGVVSLLAFGLPHKLGLMVATAAGIAAGVLAERKGLI
ncbi:MAG: Inner membrane protein YgaZ [Anaerolineae bacterium]|nr:Inner membrane protein YgaZ [Anaerolineae bacterium]